MPTTTPLDRAGKIDQLKKLMKRQVEISEWCKERISLNPGYPTWQFTGSISFEDTYGNQPTIYTGIFVFRDDDRTALKLTFGL